MLCQQFCYHPSFLSKIGSGFQISFGSPRSDQAVKETLETQLLKESFDLVRLHFFQFQLGHLFDDLYVSDDSDQFF